MAKLSMTTPEGWSRSDSDEFTPYGWQDNVTLKHDECGYTVTRAVHSLKDLDGVAREFMYEIQNHVCKPVIFVVLGAAGLETVWSTPEAAIEAREGLPSSAFITVRPMDSAEPTPASEAALTKLRKMEADRHNERAQRIREGRRRR